MAKTTERDEDKVRHESGIRGETIGQEVSAERGETPYPEWFAGEVQPPSFETAWEPPPEVTSAAPQPDQLRGELLAELQDLLRRQSARAAEDRASASHAQSRTRLASYR